MFLQAHKEVDLAPHLVIGLVFKVGDGDQFPLELRLENLDPFLRVSKQGPCLAAILKNGGLNLQGCSPWGMNTSK